MGFHNPYEQDEPVFDADRAEHGKEIAIHGRRIGLALAALIEGDRLSAKDGRDLHECVVEQFASTLYADVAEYRIFRNAAEAHPPGMLTPDMQKALERKVTAAINDYAEISADDIAADRADLANDLAREMA